MLGWGGEAFIYIYIYTLAILNFKYGARQKKPKHGDETLKLR